MSQVINQDVAGSARPEAVVERVQDLIARIEGIEDPRAREIASELAAAMVDLYGVGLSRIFAALDEGGASGHAIRDALVEDGVVGSLLLIHDLYPVPLEERVREALDKVRPYMESHGGNVEILSLDDGVARLRLHGSCHGCPSSAATLEGLIRESLLETAPDLLGLEVEGVVEPPAPTPHPQGAPSESLLPVFPAMESAATYLSCFPELGTS